MAFKDMTPKEKVLYCIQTLLKQGVKYPGVLRTRKTRDISSNQAYYTKLAVDAYQQLQPQDIEELSRKTATFKTSGMVVEYRNFMQQFKMLSDEIQAKQGVKDIGSAEDQYGELVNTIRDSIQDFLQEQFVKIDADIHKQRDFIKQKYASMTPEQFKETYGEKVYSNRPRPDGKNYYMSLSKFENSNLGVLLRLPENRLPEFITKAQENYREKEYHKIDALVFKLKQRFPELNNFVMTNFSKSIDGIEFVLTADSPQGGVTIDTNTIYAGGYNIQRLHLRWLMHVSSPQGQVEISQG